jgi:hypothetical protein
MIKKPLITAPLFFLLVLLALWLPRGLGLDRFVTVDEPKWLVRSANFYNALAHGDFKDTFQREHPGVTITWAGTAGFLWRFPGYFKIAPDHPVTPTRFHVFLHNYGVSSLDVLVAGRTFVVLGIVIALGLSFLVAARLLGILPALLAFLLIAFDPFLVALSRLLHLDGLVSALMLLSLLAFGAYLLRGRRTGDLILSAVAAGLAWLTKSPAFFLAPYYGLVLLLAYISGSAWTSGLPKGGESTGSSLFDLGRLWRTFSPLLPWFAIAAVVFVIFWPAMWVDPLGSLRRVFSLAETYAIEGHEHSSYLLGTVYPSGYLPWYFYPIAYVWRVTPSVLFGLVLAGLALIFPRWLPMPPERKWLALLLLSFSLLFALFITLSAKKFDRYLLPVFAPLDLVAALGWLALAQIIRRLANRLYPAYSWLASGTVLGVVVLAQVLGTVQTYPYYLNYYNPLWGGHRIAADVFQAGWGEGLEQAGQYLNGAPHTNKTRAISWYGDGSLSYFYDGTTVPIGMDFTLVDLRRTDYVVIYRNQWQRELPSEKFINYFNQMEPAYVVRIDGIDYVRIYDIK